MKRKRARGAGASLTWRDRRVLRLVRPLDGMPLGDAVELVRAAERYLLLPYEVDAAAAERAIRREREVNAKLAQAWIRAARKLRWRPVEGPRTHG